MQHARWLILGIISAALAGGVALVCAPPAQPVVHEAQIGDLILRYWLVSTSRVDRTYFDYVYTGSLTGAASSSEVVVTGSSSLPTTTFVDPSFSFVGSASQQGTISLDTITIRQDRSRTFDPLILTWSVLPWSPLDDSSTGVQSVAPPEITVGHVSQDEPPQIISSSVAIDTSDQLGSIRIARYANPDGLDLLSFRRAVIDSQPPADLTISTTTVAGHTSIQVTSFSERVVETLIEDGSEVVAVSGPFYPADPTNPGFQYYTSFLQNLAL